MRSACGVFGLCGVSATMLLVAIVNIRASDGELAGWLMAFNSCTIAAMGFGFPTIALCLWPFKRIASVMVGLLGIGATFHCLLADNLGSNAWVLGAKNYLPFEIAFTGGVVAHMAILICILLWVVMGQQETCGATQSSRLPETRPKASYGANRSDLAQDAVKSILRTLTFQLEPAVGKRVDLAIVYARYQAAVLMQGRQPECQSLFEDAVQALCEATTVSVQIIDRKVFLSGVTIADRAVS